MATLSAANVQAVIPQVWDTQVLQGRYGTEVIVPRVLNRSSLVEDYGQIIHIPIKPRFAGGITNTDGTFTAEAVTLTDVQVNVNTWRYVSIIVGDQQSKQSIVTLETELPSQFGARLGEFNEIALANQFLNFTGGSEGLVAGQGLGTPGAGGINFDDDTANLAVLYLRRRNIMLDECSWILSPEARNLGWLKKERLTSAMHTGEAKSSITTNKIPDILSIPAFESTLLNGSSVTDDNGTALNAASSPNLTGTSACALLHRESLAIAIQINNKVERVRTTPAQQLATLIVNQNLFGTQTVRATHGVVMYIKNS